jgi:hypothetical protein
VKRGKPLARKTRLTAKQPMKRGTKRLPKVNVRQEAKRKAKYRAFLASKEWKVLRRLALERAGNQCEEEMDDSGPCSWAPGLTEQSSCRCEETRGLQVHHETYARFGGGERLDDLVVLCKRHHEEREMQHPTRRHGR